MKSSLVEQEYWDESYQVYDALKIPPEDDQVRHWIEKYFQRGGGSCFETGCFPGRYLTVFGQLGYELYGLDLTPRVEEDLPRWLRNAGYKVGRFWRKDFFEYPESNKYEVVCSFGFIEHFINWKDVLAKQARHVKEGGYLLVQTPNFRGFVQRVLHVLLDTENCKLHNICSMNPELWGKVVEKSNFDVIFCGYFGEFDLWFGQQTRNTLQKALLVLLKRLGPTLKKLPKDKMPYSPFCGLIARKRERSRKS